MSTMDNTELVLRLYQQFDQDELDSFAGIVHPQFIASILGTTTLDWAGFKQFGSAFLAGFPDGRHVFDGVAAYGGVVAKRCKHRLRS